MARFTSMDDYTRTLEKAVGVLDAAGNRARGTAFEVLKMENAVNKASEAFNRIVYEMTAVNGVHNKMQVMKTWSEARDQILKSREAMREFRAMTLQAQVASKALALSLNFEDVFKFKSGFTGFSMGLEQLSTEAKDAAEKVKSAWSGVANVFSTPQTRFGDFSKTLFDFNRKVFDVTRVSHTLSRGGIFSEMFWKKVGTQTSLGRSQFAGLYREILEQSKGLPMAEREFLSLASTISDKFGGSIETVEDRMRRFLNLQSILPDMQERMNSFKAQGDLGFDPANLRETMFLLGEMGADKRALQFLAQFSTQTTEAERGLLKFEKSLAKRNQAAENFNVRTAKTMEEGMTALNNSLASLTNVMTEISTSLGKLNNVFFLAAKGFMAFGHMSPMFNLLSKASLLNSGLGATGAQKMLADMGVRQAGRVASSSPVSSGLSTPVSSSLSTPVSSVAGGTAATAVAGPGFLRRLFSRGSPQIPSQVPVGGVQAGPGVSRWGWGSTAATALTLGSLGTDAYGIYSAGKTEREQRERMSRLNRWGDFADPGEIETARSAAEEAGVEKRRKQRSLGWKGIGTAGGVLAGVGLAVATRGKISPYKAAAWGGALGTYVGGFFGDKEAIKTADAERGQIKRKQGLSYVIKEFGGDQKAQLLAKAERVNSDKEALAVVTEIKDKENQIAAILTLQNELGMSNVDLLELAEKTQSNKVKESVKEALSARKNLELNEQNRKSAYADYETMQQRVKLLDIVIDKTKQWNSVMKSQGDMFKEMGMIGGYVTKAYASARAAAEQNLSAVERKQAALITFFEKMEKLNPNDNAGFKSIVGEELIKLDISKESTDKLQGYIEELNNVGGSITILEEKKTKGTIDHEETKRLRDLELQRSDINSKIKTTIEQEKGLSEESRVILRGLVAQAEKRSSEEASVAKNAAKANAEWEKQQALVSVAKSMVTQYVGEHESASLLLEKQNRLAQTQADYIEKMALGMAPSYAARKRVYELTVAQRRQEEMGLEQMKKMMMYEGFSTKNGKKTLTEMGIAQKDINQIMTGNVESMLRAKQALEQAGETNAATQLQSIYNDIFEKNEKIYQLKGKELELTMKIREGYLDVLDEMTTGAGMVAELIPDMNRGIASVVDVQRLMSGADFGGAMRTGFVSMNGFGQAGNAAFAPKYTPYGLMGMGSMSPAMQTYMNQANRIHGTSTQSQWYSGVDIDKGNWHEQGMPGTPPPFGQPGFLPNPMSPHVPAAASPDGSYGGKFPSSLNGSPLDQLLPGMEPYNDTVTRNSERIDELNRKIAELTEVIRNLTGSTKPKSLPGSGIAPSVAGNRPSPAGKFSGGFVSSTMRNFGGPLRAFASGGKVDLSSGGKIPGTPAQGRDNLFATLKKGGKAENVLVGSGEYFMPASRFKGGESYSFADGINKGGDAFLNGVRNFYSGGDAYRDAYSNPVINLDGGGYIFKNSSIPKNSENKKIFDSFTRGGFVGAEKTLVEEFFNGGELKELSFGGLIPSSVTTMSSRLKNYKRANLIARNPLPVWKGIPNAIRLLSGEPIGVDQVGSASGRAAKSNVSRGIKLASGELVEIPNLVPSTSNIQTVTNSNRAVNSVAGAGPLNKKMSLIPRLSNAQKAANLSEATASSFSVPGIVTPSTKNSVGLFKKMKGLAKKGDYAAAAIQSIIGAYKAAKTPTDDILDKYSIDTKKSTPNFKDFQITGGTALYHMGNDFLGEVGSGLNLVASGAKDVVGAFKGEKRNKKDRPGALGDVMDVSESWAKRAIESNTGILKTVEGLAQIRYSPSAIGRETGYLGTAAFKIASSGMVEAYKGLFGWNKRNIIDRANEQYNEIKRLDPIKDKERIEEIKNMAEYKATFGQRSIATEMFLQGKTEGSQPISVNTQVAEEKAKVEQKTKDRLEANVSHAYELRSRGVSFGNEGELPDLSRGIQDVLNFKNFGYKMDLNDDQRLDYFKKGLKRHLPEDQYAKLENAGVFKDTKYMDVAVNSMAPELYVDFAVAVGKIKQEQESVNLYSKYLPSGIFDPNKPRDGKDVWGKTVAYMNYKKERKRLVDLDAKKQSVYKQSEKNEDDRIYQYLNGNKNLDKISRRVDYAKAFAERDKNAPLPPTIREEIINGKTVYKRVEKPISAEDARKQQDQRIKNVENKYAPVFKGFEKEAYDKAIKMAYVDKKDSKGKPIENPAEFVKKQFADEYEQKKQEHFAREANIILSNVKAGTYMPGFMERLDDLVVASRKDGNDNPDVVEIKNKTAIQYAKMIGVKDSVERSRKINSIKEERARLSKHYERVVYLKKQMSDPFGLIGEEINDAAKYGDLNKREEQIKDRLEDLNRQYQEAILPTYGEMKAARSEKFSGRQRKEMDRRSEIYVGEGENTHLGIRVFEKAKKDIFDREKETHKGVRSMYMNEDYSLDRARDEVAKMDVFKSFQETDESGQEWQVNVIYSAYGSGTSRYKVNTSAEKSKEIEDRAKGLKPKKKAKKVAYDGGLLDRYADGGLTVNKKRKPIKFAADLYNRPEEKIVQPTVPVLTRAPTEIAVELASQRRNEEETVRINKMRERDRTSSSSDFDSEVIKREVLQQQRFKERDMAIERYRAGQSSFKNESELREEFDRIDSRYSNGQAELSNRSQTTSIGVRNPNRSLHEIAVDLSTQKRNEDKISLSNRRKTNHPSDFDSEVIKREVLQQQRFKERDVAIGYYNKYKTLKAKGVSNLSDEERVQFSSLSKYFTGDVKFDEQKVIKSFDRIDKKYEQHQFGGSVKLSRFNLGGNISNITSNERKGNSSVNAYNIGGNTSSAMNAYNIGGNVSSDSHSTNLMNKYVSGGSVKLSRFNLGGNTIDLSSGGKIPGTPAQGRDNLFATFGNGINRESVLVGSDEYFVPGKVLKTGADLDFAKNLNAQGEKYLDGIKPKLMGGLVKQYSSGGMTGSSKDYAYNAAYNDASSKTMTINLGDGGFVFRRDSIPKSSENKRIFDSFIRGGLRGVEETAGQMHSGGFVKEFSSGGYVGNSFKNHADPVVKYVNGGLMTGANEAKLFNGGALDIRIPEIRTADMGGEITAASVSGLQQSVGNTQVPQANSGGQTSTASMYLTGLNIDRLYLGGRLAATNAKSDGTEFFKKLNLQVRG